MYKNTKPGFGRMLKSLALRMGGGQGNVLFTSLLTEAGAQARPLNRPSSDGTVQYGVTSQRGSTVVHVRKDVVVRIEQ